jgi:Transposase IS66 family
MRAPDAPCSRSAKSIQRARRLLSRSAGAPRRYMPDNNAAERQIRPLALGRKNYLFDGSDAGGERAAALYTLVETAKLKPPRSRSLPARRAHSHRRPQDQPHRRPAPLEHWRARTPARRRVNAILTPRSPQRRDDAYLVSSSVDCRRSALDSARQQTPQRPKSRRQQPSRARDVKKRAFHVQLLLSFLGGGNRLWLSFRRHQSGGFDTGEHTASFLEPAS